MSKYLLIPVEEIEKTINILTKYLEIAPTKLDQGKRQILYELLDTHKQISLDEKDIEEKATKSSVKNCQFAYPKTERTKFKKGYKQALLDIKKELL